jgi:hypothetical protein
MSVLRKVLTAFLRHRRADAEARALADSATLRFAEPTPSRADEIDRLEAVVSDATRAVSLGATLASRTEMADEMTELEREAARSVLLREASELREDARESLVAARLALEQFDRDSERDRDRKTVLGVKARRGSECWSAEVTYSRPIADEQPDGEDPIGGVVIRVSHHYVAFEDAARG